jgi:hypothetical protein
MIEWIPGAWHQWWLTRKRRLDLVDYTEEWQRFRWAYCWPWPPPWRHEYGMEEV